MMSDKQVVLYTGEWAPLGSLNIESTFKDNLLAICLGNQTTKSNKESNEKKKDGEAKMKRIKWDPQAFILSNSRIGLLFSHIFNGCKSVEFYDFEKRCECLQMDSIYTIFCWIPKPSGAANANANDDTDETLLVYDGERKELAILQCANK